MDAGQQEQLRNLLEEERDSVARQLKEHGVPDGENVEVSVDEGFADSGHATTERSQLLSIIEQLQSHRQAIDAALKRMDEGTFGKCERCGTDIPFERLEARPAATLCVEHAQASGG